MDKRQFLTAAALSAAAAPALAKGGAADGPAASPTLLTLTGAIGRANRGPFDPALDQLMHKFDLHFDRAFTFDFPALARLPATAIRPTLEYDGKLHRLRGPLIAEVMQAAGAPTAGQARLAMRAIDGYAVELSLAEASRYGFIIATHLDDQPLPLGGLGPLWAVYEADRFPEIAGKPLPERYAGCPWGLFYIEVQAG